MLPEVLWKESVNSDGHPFPQYQQNKKKTPLILSELTEHKV